MVSRLAVGSIVGAAIVLASCASTPNMWTASHVRGEYSYSGDEPVLLALPNDAGDDDEALMEVARAGLEKRGVNLVSDVHQAQRIVSFRMSRDISFQTSVHQLTRSDHGMGDQFEWQEVTSLGTSDSGKTQVFAEMLDVTDLKQHGAPVIWEAFVVVDNEHYEQFPELVVEKLLATYGKNEVKDLKFKPPFESKDKKKKQN